MNKGREKNVASATTFSHVKSVAPLGFEGTIIDIECDMTNGLPGILLVGMGNKAVEEAKERVRSAINNSSLHMPKKKITLSMAPSDLPKTGSSYDLPLAIAILASSKQLPESALRKTLIAGELALDGSLRPISSAINVAETAQRLGYKQVIVPYQNAAEAALVKGVDIFGFTSLREVYRYLCGDIKISPYRLRAELPSDERGARYRFHDIAGQSMAKRALQIAVAGGHNVLLTGPPGTGKTMLARASAAILPQLSPQERLTVTKLHSAAGAVSGGLVKSPPFRAPHHSVSHVALIGGGRYSKPGEVSMSQHGILFLDELPEFSRQALESLRQPLEDGFVSVSRAEQTIDYPADFILIATSNPCPCGYYGDQLQECICTIQAVQRYQSRVSGPMMDRIDIRVGVERISHDRIMAHLSSRQGSADDAGIALCVEKARQLQLNRQGTLNNHLSGGDLHKHLRVSEEVRVMISKAAEKLQLSPRSFVRVLRVARTIADFEESPTIREQDVLESLRYR